ncbi:MAG: WbuC family cupin fold metalloprotein [Pseudomonadota bacterium]
MDTQNVFFPDPSDIVCFNIEDLPAIKTAAEKSNLKRARYCLHASHDDGVQEMVLVLIKDTVVPIHRHPNKSESFHIIEGQLEVALFNDSGDQIDSIKMGPIGSGLNFIYRINTSAWHTVRVISDMVVIHETIEGPFNCKMDVLSPQPLVDVIE